jgi:hypothetical protein
MINLPERRRGLFWLTVFPSIISGPQYIMAGAGDGAKKRGRD